MRPALHGFHRDFLVALACQHDYFRRIGSLMHTAQQFHAIHARHIDVAQQHIDIAFFQFAQCCFAVSRSLHAVTESLKFFL